MATEPGTCDCCKLEPAVGVAAVPGCPLSIRWGRTCLEKDALPLFVAELWLRENVKPQEPVDIAVGIASRGRWTRLPGEPRKRLTFFDRRYLRIEQLPLEVVSCATCKGTGRADRARRVGAEESDRERVENACPNCYRGRHVAVKGSGPRRF